MQIMKWSAIAFAVAAASTQMAVASQQDNAQGFIEDSKLQLDSRMFYFNRDFRNGGTNISPKGKKNGYGEELGLGFKARYQSGFTQGTVGVGVDAFGLQSIKLDSGGGRHFGGAAFFGEKSNGKARNNASQAGAAVKARISNTTLKYGRQTDVDMPVFSMDDSRLLQETSTGFLVTSEEIDGLQLNAGHFTQLSDLNQVRADSSPLKKIDFVGGNYAITDDLNVAYYYADADLDESWGYKSSKKHYLGADYHYDLAADQALDFDFNFYRTKLGNRHESNDRNKAWSLAAAYTIDAHKFTVGHQRISGDTGYEYGYDGGGSIYLLNDVQRNSFIGEDENSWQVRYDLDMGKFGVEGLNLMTRYVRGSNVKTAEGNHNGKNWERDIEAGYTFQQGAAKDLNIRVRQATYRASHLGNVDTDEVRVIVNYPLSIL
ncbi:OprD family outer membrane porin [Thiopseudomonas alkaliphila]|uniref:OprD family outer membrane porin n=1 Tax=Thiopseudomonas alkaliphila TaxID=1697053 RepID=UPI002575500D|nr:OprD family outer membrane porin [Thiopseudomonas alkaliphila]MDM1717405.1 outer membrane porin, OprD family [Thiopseudomonas alkaliphila]